MAKYIVKVAITYHKELSIFAKDDEMAGDKAEELVQGWNGVEDVEILEISEE